MRAHPVQFIKDIFWYSGGNIFGRVVTLFLLPLTTAFLSPNDYGIIGILLLLSTMVTSFMSLGFQTAVGRVYAMGSTEKEREGIIWTAFLALLINNICWILAGFFIAPYISQLLFKSSNESSLVTLALIAAAIAAPKSAFEYYLRAIQKSKLVFLLNIADVIISIATMIYMVVYLENGPKGYMEATILAQSLSLLMLVIVVAPNLHFSFLPHYLKELLKIGAPCIYGYWGYFVLHAASRMVLQLFSTEQEVGFYFLGSNIGKIIELPLIGFSSAWTPYFHSYLRNQEDAPAAFSKMMTSYLVGMSCLIVPVFCLAKPVVYFFVQRPFHEIWDVVGLSAASIALWGVYTITYPALIFNKKTGWQAAMELTAGGLCIILNILLVIPFGKMGAAWATLFSFFALCLMSGWMNSKFLHVTYEYGRIGKIILGTICASALSFLPLPLNVYVCLMIVSILAYLFYVWNAILSAQEKSMLYTLWKKQPLKESA